MRLGRIAVPGSALTSQRDRALRTSFCGNLQRQKEERDETDFEKIQPLGRGRVHIRVSRDDGARRSGRRLLYYEWRPSSSWLRLSEHGNLPGRILGHRRYLLAQFLVQESQRCPGLSTKAATFTKRASFPESTYRELTGRAEIRFEWCGPRA
jgi:hypothetical protein